MVCCGAIQALKKMKSKNLISFFSILSFIVPLITITICYYILINNTSLKTFPFIDGRISISYLGRQDLTIEIFKTGMLLFVLISFFFYFYISNFFQQIKFENRLKIYGIIANFFLVIYIFTLGNNLEFYKILRKIGIVLYIITMYINHIYTIKLLKKNKKFRFNNLSLNILIAIIIIMTGLIIVGSPWIISSFEYSDQMKNIVEWNYFLLMVLFYVPVSLLFYKLRKFPQL